MLLGIGLHASLSFFPSFWPAQDNKSDDSGGFDILLHGIHGFRMPLFFLLSGFFTAMLWRRRGLIPLLLHRTRRIVLPLALGLITIIPAVDWVSERATKGSITNWAMQAAKGGDIWTPIFMNQPDAIPVAITNGADVDTRGDDKGTPLHLAAFMDLPDVTQALLNTGADYRLENKDGSTPLQVAIWVGSTRVADLLVAAGADDSRYRTSDQAWQNINFFGDGAEFRQLVLEPEVEDETGLDSWIDQFHHLWFLWFLCWLVAGFVLVAPLADEIGKNIGSLKLRRRLLWVAFPLTLILQARMGDSGNYETFGPDTSTGLLPATHVILYYAVFFAYGAIAFGARTDNGEPLIDHLGRHWSIVLPITVVVIFPAALAYTFGDWRNTEMAVLLQTLYVWSMTFGLVGLFRQLLSDERYWVRYLSDASYWMYVIHLPLVILAQDWVRNWDIPRIPKFLAICWGVSGLLLLTYRYLVRYTPIGTLLNGRRTRPNPTLANTNPGGNF